MYSTHVANLSSREIVCFSKIGKKAFSTNSRPKDLKCVSILNNSFNKIGLIVPFEAN